MQVISLITEKSIISRHLNIHVDTSKGFNLETDMDINM